MSNLFNILSWVLESGAGVLAWFVVDRWPWAQSLEYEPKRWVALCVSAVFALGAWGLMLLMFYEAAPAGWRGWLEGAVAVLAKTMPFVFTVSQVAHARATASRELALRG